MTEKYENTLRSIIIQALGSHDDSDYKVSEDRINKWKEKREIETKKYKGSNTENRLIYFSDFYDLKNIIIKNWEVFNPTLLNKKKFEVFFDEIEKFRNTLAHGRTIHSYQESLLNGITEELILNQVNYHNKNLNVEDYFLKIIRFSDNIGTVWEIGDPTIFDSSTKLLVGNTLEFFIETFDPKGRNIEVELIHNSTDEKFKFSNNRLSIEITENMIAKKSGFRICASSNESIYDNSETLIVMYTILPKE